MSDLDFDELDKAVSTLMGDVPKVELPKTNDVKTLNINSTLPDESRPSLAKLDSELSKVNNTAPSSVEVSIVTSPASAPAPAPSLATRRGGRFMDVVHPSSDMKGVSKPAAPASRQGVTIEPAGLSSLGHADEKEESATNDEQVTDAPAADLVGLASNSKAEAHNEHGVSKNDWPDPLDMMAYTKEPDTSGAVAATETVTLENLPVATDMDDADLHPLASPFLPDAKVEKRPLGGAPAEEVKKDDEMKNEELSRAPAAGVVSADDIVVEDAAEQLPAEPLMVEQPLPPELQSDLMAIETDGGTTATTVKAAEEDKTPVVEKPVEKTPDAPAVPAPEKKPLGESAAVAVSSPVAATLTGPTSIPQQYHEEPTTSDQTNGAIYDTDSYHQPLAHPAKTKSGWLWIIWILLLLMVGGGGAVALYFLGII